MSDAAAQAEEVTPQEVEVDESIETTATDYEAEATEYKKRFSGSQKALNEALAAKKALEAEAEALRKFKAEAERANMTELERLQAERDEAIRAAETARTEAQRERLARTYPLAVELLGDAPLPSEERLATIEERLKGETEVEPRIDPNHPRRSVPVVSDEEAHKAELAKADLAFRAMFEQGV